jgi:glyoxylase-like metal-dependent hydrolase (beta-lactamase superfamily II)
VSLRDASEGEAPTGSPAAPEPALPESGAESAGLTFPWADAPAEGELREVAEGVLWARLPLPMALDHVNVYFLREPEGWAMVDTGLDTRRTRALLEALIERLDAPVTRLLATHYHPDHLGLAGWLQDRGAELICTRTTWLTARMLQLDVQDRPDAQTVGFWRRNGMDPKVIARRVSERPFNFADCTAPLPLGYTRIRAGDRLRLGGRDWIVAEGNGHAWEHAVLFEDGGALVLGGDQILPGISPNIGVHASEPMADPLAAWIESCHALSALARPGHLVLPGHKLPFRNLRLRLRQIIANHEGALARLDAHLSRPRTGGECFAPLFKRQIDAGTYGLAFVETVAHLNHLLLSGRVRRWDRGDGVWLWQSVKSADAGP